MLTVYDASEVTVAFAGVPLAGYADGDFCQIEEEGEAFTDVCGADGEVARARNQDRRATVTVTLLASSPSNDFLSALSNLDRAAPGGAGVGALLIRDRNGRALYTAPQAWIQKAPSVTFGKEVGSRAWTIRCAKLLRFDGGNGAAVGGVPV